MSDKDNTKMLVLLAVGAYLLTKRAPAMAYGGSAALPQGGRPTMNSIPASIGSGVGQVLGGALGGLIKNMWGGSSNTYDWSSSSPYVSDGSGAYPEPDWDAAFQQNPELMDNVTMYGV